MIDQDDLYDDRDEPRRIFIHKGARVKFYLSHSLTADDKIELTRKIHVSHALLLLVYSNSRLLQRHGGRIVKRPEEAETIIVRPEIVDYERLKRGVSDDERRRNTFVEEPKYIDLCIEVGDYRHEMVKPKGMPGRHAG